MSWRQRDPFRGYFNNSDKNWWRPNLMEMRTWTWSMFGRRFEDRTASTIEAQCGRMKEFERMLRWHESLDHQGERSYPVFREGEPSSSSSNSCSLIIVFKQMEITFTPGYPAFCIYLWEVWSFAGRMRMLSIKARRRSKTGEEKRSTVKPWIASNLFCECSTRRTNVSNKF